MSIVLVLGSGPNVLTARDWPRDAFDTIVAINNAWAVRPDWDLLIHPDDFPRDRWPTEQSPVQKVVRAEEYVPRQNHFGGFVYAGGTMAFTAGYWALSALRPKVVAMIGCDMVYPKTRATHFYGTGAADPLREDITLRSLEAKSARMMILGAMAGCAFVNLSKDPSRLVLPRADPDGLDTVAPQKFDPDLAARALTEEDRLGYRVPSGKYWQEEHRFDPVAIDALDALWLRAARPVGTTA